jgi:hypothetical protein
VELDGEKKPRAKSPPSEVIVELNKSGFPGTSRSSEVHNVGKRRRAVIQMETELMDAKTFCWNVRGLNAAAQRATVRNTVISTGATIVCLQETKIAHWTSN